ncbi:hypothetical protein [Nocardia sp. XZ_19_369]|uniref:hypothetical protein n=1 Tax=Nocardia sp. XZ_19_369 TaxID=2769487 RepID=UPI00188FE883|nr:hypothetical protein [Nocardia sp. XZ_19_369]
MAEASTITTTIVSAMFAGSIHKMVTVPGSNIAEAVAEPFSAVSLAQLNIRRSG